MLVWTSQSSVVHMSISRRIRAASQSSTSVTARAAGLLLGVRESEAALLQEEGAGVGGEGAHAWGGGRGLRVGVTDLRVPRAGSRPLGGAVHPE